ncbi:S26 family signal peptidase, partial [Mesorhizobium sp.]|uniref:S26 family signal peptidase n=1 Tax=Mesorhizobium sp. TaxID=1871066 RepID=UPI00257FC415
SRIEVTDLVVVRPPEPLAAFLAERGYLPRGVALIKRVLATSGDTVCRRGLTVISDDRTYGVAHENDNRGRPLPVWQGCHTLTEGEVFLMNWDTADSLDGRYFGPLPASSIVARALPIWTDADGDGRFHWHVGDASDAP